MDKERTGQYIRELRKKKNFTQLQLAEQLHISDKTVSKWERGISFPDIELLEPLAELLDTDVVALLGCAASRTQDVPSYTTDEELLPRAKVNALMNDTIDMARDGHKKLRQRSRQVVLALLLCVAVLLALNFRSIQREYFLVWHTTMTAEVVRVEDAQIWVEGLDMYEGEYRQEFLLMCDDTTRLSDNRSDETISQLKDLSAGTIIEVEYNSTRHNMEQKHQIEPTKITIIANQAYNTRGL